MPYVDEPLWNPKQAHFRKAVVSIVQTLVNKKVEAAESDSASLASSLLAFATH